MANHFKLVTEDNFDEEVVQHDGIVVLTFSHPHCAPCRALLDPLTELADQTGVKIVKCDTSKDINLANRFFVSTVPMTFFLRRGEVVNMWNGPANLAKLQSLLEESQ